MKTTKQIRDLMATIESNHDLRPILTQAVLSEVPGMCDRLDQQEAAMREAEGRTPVVDLVRAELATVRKKLDAARAEANNLAASLIEFRHSKRDGDMAE